MSSYKVLNEMVYKTGVYSLVPIRYIDRFDIMNWRNEQIYHLRQDKLLTIEDQESYFTNILKPLFSDDNPSQILFSFLKSNKCIGYGGLVHINWKDKNAEISFVMKTDLEPNHFYKLWNIYLSLIEEIAFKEIRLHKVYTYAYDLRPILFQVLVDSGYYEEATLFEHVLIENSFKNIRIHSKFNKII
jgi:hypothetical protein